jgi:hypothetical protein
LPESTQAARFRETLNLVFVKEDAVKRALLLLIGLLVATSLACGFNVSTANIAEATMAKDPEGANPTTTFNQEDVFYAVVQLANAPDSTTVKASWVAVDAEGVEPGQVIDEVELTSGSGQLQFDLSNDKLWPTGNYKVDLYLNEELDQSLTFEVVGEAVVEENGSDGDAVDEGDVAAEPEAEVTEEEPTATPEPEETEPTATPQSSAGDTLGSAAQPTEAPVDETETETEPEPLALGSEPYVHPSGAFEFGVPEVWESYGEDELSANFGDDQNRFGAIFLDTGTVLDEPDLIELAETSVGIVIESFAQNYEIIGDNNRLEESGLYYIAAEFNDGRGAADLWFEQNDNIIFIFYFASLMYEETLPTRDVILDTYKIDVDAALAATPDEAEAPAPAAPPPTPVPQPAANPFQPPAGVARVFLQNEYGSEYNIDFGDGSGSIVVMPGAQNFYHDVSPGKYNPGLSLPGGGATNVEFDIQPNQAYVILVTGDLGVRWGQVYP